MSSFVWCIFGVVFATLIFTTLWFLDIKRRKLRIKGLTQYLEAASCSKVAVLARIDDEFSMLEDELYKTVSELRITKEQALQERNIQADNLADIAHQLKTPLTSMSLMTQLLAQNATKEQYEYIERLDNQLSRLEWLTSSLLTMSRLDAGAINFTQKELSFEALIAQATEPMERTLQSRNQTIMVIGIEGILCCDPIWTGEALLNLIKNCSEHTPNGSKILLKYSTTPLYIQIDVEDNGTGFSPDELPKVFRRFYRGKNANKNSIGIGLALCRSIIEGQGGTIHAENRKEGGARFTIRLYPRK